jgi:serine O-acetyltransferase
MKRVIEADLFRYGGLSGLKGLLKGLLIPGFRYTYLLRKASQYEKFSLLWWFFYFIKRKYSFKYGFQIPTSTEIGEGLYIGHYGTIVINGKSKIGKNCNIAHGVTIGQANRGRLKGYPTIGDNVWIGTGAVIVGKITIGSNILIAPNSFVNIDIADNSLVIGNPCKIIHKENPCFSYIEFILSGI